MTQTQLEVLSNQAVAACGVVYFLAVLAHVWQWSAARRVPAEAQQRMPATVGGSAPLPDQAPAYDAEEPAERFGRIGVALTIVAAAVQFVAVVARGLAADPNRVPWGNMYEFTLTGSFVVVVGYLAVYRRYSLGWLAPVVTSFTLVLLMVDVLVLYMPVTPLRDALQSPWLVIHVIAAIVAVGAFTLGGMCSVLFLIKSYWLERHDAGAAKGGYLERLPDLGTLDRMAYRMHAFGFPIWTFAALIAGPIWAYQAWGRAWGWDPKEVWAFITWVVYAAYLHARATAGWRGRSAAVVALIGLGTLWFNFVGINYFFGTGSLHAYAAPAAVVRSLLL